MRVGLFAFCFKIHHQSIVRVDVFLLIEPSPEVDLSSLGFLINFLHVHGLNVAKIVRHIRVVDPELDIFFFGVLELREHFALDETLDFDGFALYETELLLGNFPEIDFADNIILEGLSLRFLWQRHVHHQERIESC